ncbi:hypothetical protein LIER_35645 [Lithospermum erythrorhizon]|uniref:Uncharacterized protein n=1 Tax=Lithospermum erythrorhizon TaxID=34254 RepID=A0AAV3NUD2_LITER
MVKTRGGSTSGTSKSSNRVRETVDGQPILLQENAAIEESNPELKEKIQPEHNGTSRGMEVENVVDEKSAELKRVSREVEGVKDTSAETSYKSAKTHSSVDPMVAEILVGMRDTGGVGKKGGRFKRRLRKQGMPVRHVGSAAGEGVDSPKENQDDDVVVVSSTASRRRTRASAVAFEKKGAAQGVGGDASGFAKPEEAIDLEELERLVEEKKTAKKGKSKAKKPSGVESKGHTHKKRNSVVISEPSHGKDGDNFIVDDEEASEGKDKAARKRYKGKLKVNDDRNMINNRRIAKDVENVSAEGVDFSTDKNVVR